MRDHVFVTFVLLVAFSIISIYTVSSKNILFSANSLSNANQHHAVTGAAFCFSLLVLINATARKFLLILHTRTEEYARWSPI